MKKALTILVIFAIVLSLSASAFADNGGIKITKTVVDPDGYRYSVDEFRSFFPNSYISGDTTGTLIINNVNADMNGYRFFCTFSNSNGADSTTEAVLHIIYQGKTLDIPAGIFVDLVPGSRVDSNGQVYFPTYW